jgi:quinol monooxygenase YgiN
VIYGSATFEIRPEELDACLDAIRTFVDRLRQEPGTRSYVSMRSTQVPTRFLHLFVFDGEAARDAHASSEAVQAFTAELYPRCVAPVAFDEFVEVDRAGSAH